MRQVRKIVMGVVTLCVFTAIGISVRADDPQKGQVPLGLLRLGDGVLFPSFAFVVDKSQKKIFVIDNSASGPTVAETYDADLGKAPGDKWAMGDSRTPEGIYFLQKRREGPGLDPFKYGIMAFVTDYPNFFDLRAGKTGNGIWLHAISDKVSLERGSKGCVVVRNDTIKKLAPDITLRETPLLIFDKVQWVTTDEEQKDAAPILEAVGQWKKAWEGKDLDAYMNFYDKDFIGNHMGFKAWRRFKAGLASRYEQIKVSISMPVIYAHNDTVVVRFFQDYQSNLHSDFGEKTLYFLKRPDGYKILGEKWQEATNPKARELLAGGTNLCCTIHN